MSITGSNNPFACEPVVFANANSIVSLGTITRNGNQFTFSVGFVWKINGVTYQNTAPVVLTITEASDGFNRIDNALLNTSNTIELQQGLESETIALKPVAPDTNIILTSWNISGNTIGDSEDPIIGTSFIKKSFSAHFAFNGSGVDTSIPLNPNGYSEIRVTNPALESIAGVDLSLISGNPSAEVPYTGKMYLLKNITGNAITIKHNSEIADIPFYTNDEQNLEVPNKGIIIFTYDNAVCEILLTNFSEEIDPIFQASEASLFVTGDKDNLDNQSGINTGDETTESIQIKRPLKTINNQSLEGTGNIDIETANDFPYTEITKAELDTLIANSELTKGFYKIPGVNPTLYGGTTILVEVLEDNKLPLDGYGLFYNPKYNKAITGFGVAKDYVFWEYVSNQLESGVYAIGANVIWGGKHWICVAETDINTKYIVDKFNLSTDYFEEVPFDNIEYNLVLDKIKYDYEHDLIIERNEKNSNVVSFSYDSSFFVGNPIKSFQWGNLFDYDLEKGIGNNKIYDSLNENINFIGKYQINLNFSNGSYQNRFIFDNYSYQENLNFSNGSYQDRFIFKDSNGQSNLTFSNGSGQDSLTFSKGSYQSNLIFENSSQYGLVLNDYISQRKLVLNSYIRSFMTIAENEINLTFDSNKQALKLTANQFFTGKTTNDFAQMGDIYDLGAVAFSNDYNDLGNKPNIPTLTSQLTNDSGFITNVITALGFTPENSANKSTSVTTDSASNTKYPSVKAVFDWANSVFTTPSAVATQITTALVGYATQSWVNSQGFITNVITALGYTPLPTTAGTATGTTLSFITDKIYGTLTTPEIGNITADVTNAKLGVTNIIIHNSGTAPTFDSKFKKLSGSGNYVTGVVNYIYCTYISATEIIYSINQRA